MINIFFNSLKTFGITSSIDFSLALASSFAFLVMYLGVLLPATTSSPWALIKYSPKNLFSPVDGFLVNATPVAQSFPMFPKTIDWTFTAVPQLLGIWLSFL